VQQRAESQQRPASQPGESLSFGAAAEEFVRYLRGYRSFSPSTVRAYEIDLHQFREFLVEAIGEVPAPEAITRQQVLAWGLKLRGLKPLIIRRKYASSPPLRPFRTWAAARAILR